MLTGVICCTLIYFINISILDLLSVSINFSSKYAYTYALNLPGLALFYAGVVVGIFVLVLSDTRIFLYKTLAGLGLLFFFTLI